MSSVGQNLTRMKTRVKNVFFCKGLKMTLKGVTIYFLVTESISETKDDNASVLTVLISFAPLHTSEEISHRFSFAVV